MNGVVYKRERATDESKSRTTLIEYYNNIIDMALKCDKYYMDAGHTYSTILNMSEDEHTLPLAFKAYTEPTERILKYFDGVAIHNASKDSMKEYSNRYEKLLKENKRAITKI